MGVAGRYIPVTNHVALFAAVASPYLTLTGILAVIVAVIAKRWLLVLAAASLVLAGVLAHVPMYVDSAHGQQGATPVRIMTANLGMGRADAEALVAAARSDADVLAVQELTYDSADRLSAAGMDSAFPYRSLHPQADASGAGLWSRYPISSVAPIWGFEMAFISARLLIDGVPVDPRIVVAHVSGPWPQPIKDWREDMHLLAETMADEAKTPGAVLFAGDFNATVDMRPFRELLTTGYHDAAEQAGAGTAPTFPARSRIPPLLGIDHILVRNATATAVETGPVPGSDHRALVATVEFS